MQSYLKQFYKTSTLSVTLLTASITLTILLLLDIVQFSPVFIDKEGTK